MGVYRNKVSMQDIADKLGVSKTAVSLALRDRPGVSPENKDQILQEATRLGYVGLRSEKKKRTDTILVLVPNYIRDDPYFYNPIYWEIEGEIKKIGLNVVMCTITAPMESQLQLPDIYFEIPFIGIITIGVFAYTYMRRLADENLPIVSVDNTYPGLQVDAILTANLKASCEATNYLIRKGHREIGFVGSIRMTDSIYERWCGFQKAMLLADLPVNLDYCILENSALGTLLNSTEEIEHCLDRIERFPSVWFCAGDRMAIALITALTRRGLRVPQDVSVMGFDDIEVSKLISPALTTMHIDKEMMGREAVHHLLHLAKDRIPSREIILCPDLVERESVADLSGNS